MDTDRVATTMLKSAVLLLALLLIASCRDSNDSPQAASTASGGTLTVEVTSTPDQTGVVRNEIAPVLAAEGGRADCPSSWLVYGTASYSVCYPPDYYAQTWSTAELRERFSVRLIPGEPVAYTWWAMGLWSTDRYEPPEVCEYRQEVADPDAITELSEFELDGHTGIVCRAQAGEAVQFKGAVETPDGGFYFDIGAGGDEQLDLGMTILDTVDIAD